MHAIDAHINIGSTMYSNNRQGYKFQELKDACFQHFTVKHKYSFVNPDSSINILMIGHLWGSAKWANTVNIWFLIYLNLSEEKKNKNKKNFMKFCLN